MPEKLESLVRAAVLRAQEAHDLPAFEVTELFFERPQDTSNGDWSSTLAMKSARLAHMAPRKIAEAIVAHLADDEAIERVEIAGPGFMNFYLSVASSNEVFQTVIDEGFDFGRSNVGKGQKVQLEYVSANPVGPMHIGHGRWAAIGDSLANIMDHAGYDVSREYYINDHGSQMDVFGRSVAMRYLQLFDLVDGGMDLDAAYEALLSDRAKYVADELDEHPDTHPLTDAFLSALGENSYGGDYIVDIALAFAREFGDAWRTIGEDERVAECRERGYLMMLDSIRETCHEARADFDVWFSERSLYEVDGTGTDAVHRAFAALD